MLQLMVDVGCGGHCYDLNENQKFVAQAAFVEGVYRMGSKCLARVVEQGAQ
jgi:hypothetical protein